MNYKYLLYFLFTLCGYYYVKTPDNKIKIVTSTLMIILAAIITIMTIRDNKKRRRKDE